MALLLEQDSFFTDYGIRADYEKSFGAVDDEDAFKRSLYELTSNDTMIAFDVEDDGLDGVYVDHEKHGTIDLSECSIMGTDRYYSIGPAFPVALHADLGAISEAAVDGGLSEAFRMISMLPVDSSAWTGISKDFRFTAEVQTKLVSTLEIARNQISTLQLSNVEAARAKAYIDCALMLADLPDPEPDVIAMLIKRLLLVVGAVGVFADLKGIFA